MMFKLVLGLFLCGEVLDIYGYIGGYNIISVFVIGYVVGLYVGYYLYVLME